MSLSIDVRSRTTGETVVTVRGELGAATAPRLLGLVEDILRSRPAGLCLDLALVTYADGPGVGALLQIERGCSAIACRLVVERISPALERVLATVGVSASLWTRAW